MQHKTVSTFEEDMQKFGLSTSVADQRTLSGMGTLTEDAVVMASQPGRDAAVVEGLQTLQHFGTPVTEQDPIEGSVVTHELFNRIAGLDFSRLTVENVDEILDHLKVKDLPDGDERLAARAAEVVNMLIAHKGQLDEASVFRTFAARSGKMVTKHRRTGTKARKARMLSKKYRRMHKGQIVRQAKKREHKGWFKRVMKMRAAKMGGAVAKRAIRPIRNLVGAGKPSAGGMASLAASADMEIANDLRGVLSESRVQAGARSEVIERLNNIFALVSEMYDSESIDDVLEEAFLPVVERAGAGTLTEDTLNDEEFVAALAPCLNVVTRVMESIENGEVDFDYLGDEADDDEDEDESGN
jgi:hypothetical protein